MALGFGAEVLEVAVERGEGAGDAHDGLDDEGGDVVGVGGEEVGGSAFVVEGQFEDEGVVAGDEAGLGLAVVDLPVVVGAVVGAGHLDDLVSTSEGAGGAHGEHGGLAAGVGEADHLQGGMRSRRSSTSSRAWGLAAL